MRLDDKFDDFPGIYIIKNIKNDKIYVGESLNIKNRLYQHCYGGNQVIQKAIKKYGIDNFFVYVEYLPSFTKEDLLNVEEQLILDYDSISPKGYNICKRGNDATGCIQTEESKLRKSLALKGIKRSDEEIKKSSIARTGLTRTIEQKINMSNAHKGLSNGPRTEEDKLKIKNSLIERYKTEKHPMTGRKQTQEFKDRLSILKKGKSNEKAKKSILQIDPISLKVLKEWPSTIDAVLELYKDPTKSSSISAALNGKYKTALGFKWQFKE